MARGFMVAPNPAPGVLGTPTPLEVAGTVTGSMLADQLYCEALLDQRLRSGHYRSLKPGEARRIARLMVEAIGSHGEWGVERLTVVGEAAGVYWAISPDAVVVSSGRVVGLVRARLRRRLRAYESDYALLEIAALVLEGQGLLGEDPVLAVAVAETGEALAQALAHALRPPKPRPGSGDGWVVSTRIHDPQAARGLASDLAGYWLGRRPPRPNPRACRSCPLRGSCPYSRGTPRFN